MQKKRVLAPVPHMPSLTCNTTTYVAIATNDLSKPCSFYRLDESLPFFTSTSVTCKSWIMETTIFTGYSATRLSSFVRIFSACSIRVLCHRNICRLTRFAFTSLDTTISVAKSAASLLHCNRFFLAQHQSPRVRKPAVSLDLT